MTLSAIAGHARVVQQLRAAVLADRPASAYLLAGPAGIGKRTVADAFTASLLCEQPVDGDACGVCPHCTRVAAGTHPDVHLVRREEDRRDVRTEQAREVTRWLMLRPLFGRRKIAVIEDAECLNEHGQNALLKTLEEPPGAAVLLVLATDGALLLPTVRSRCLRLRLDPLPAPVLEDLLRGKGVPVDKLAGVVARAEGSPGRALALVDDAGAAARGKVLDLLARLEATTAADLSSTAQALARDDTEAALATAAAWYRDVLGLTLEGPEASVRNLDVLEPLRAAAGRLSPLRALGALEAVCDTIRAVERNANRVLALETMWLRLRWLERGERPSLA